MRNRLITTLALAVLVAAAGCTIPGGGGGTEGGTLGVYVSDQPNAIDDFTHLNATITGVAVHSASNDSWTVYNTTRTVDLTRLQGANATLLTNATLPPGKYTMVALRVSNVSGELRNGQYVNVTVPSDTLRLNEPFTVESGNTTTFVYDLRVVRHGSHRYSVQPNAGESGPGEPIQRVPNVTA